MAAQQQVAGSLWRLAAMRALVGAGVLGFVSYSLTLAALPLYAVGGGAPLEVAGLVTTVMLAATVVSQTAVPWLVRRLGLGPVFAGGLIALGAPAPLYVLGNGVAWLSAVSVLRGVGFAVLTVLGFTLCAQIVPLHRRGEAIGVFGLSLALPNLVGIPAGVALVLSGHVGWMAWLAGVPVLGALLVPAVVRAVPPGEGTPGAGVGGLRTAARAAAVPSLLLALVTLTGGGLLTFLPIERPDGVLATVALLVFGISSALTRWQAGVLADRASGGRWLMPGSLGTAAVGIAVVAGGLVLHRGGAATIVTGALVFGAGYGALQSLTLVAAFQRAGASGTTAASAVWNACYDSGTAVGAVTVGALAVAIGLPWTYLVLAGLLVAALPLATSRPRRS